MDEVSPHILQSREKFQDFSYMFENYAKKYTPAVSEEFRDLFDEFISFVQEVPRDAVIYPDYDTVLNSLAAIVSSRRPDFSVKLCHPICCLLGKHNVRLTNHLNEKLLAVCLKGLNKHNSDDDNVLILKAVTMLLRADDNHLLARNEFFHSLASPPNGFLLEFMSEEEASGQLLLAAVGCLELLLLPSSSLSSQDDPSEFQPLTSEVSEACMKSVISVLGRGKPPHMNDLEYCKMVIASLRCLHHLLSPNATSPSPSPLTIPGRLGELIGVIRDFLGLGLPGVSDSIKYPVGPFKAQSSSAVQVPSQEDAKDSYKGRATKAMRKNRKKTAKIGAAVLVDTIEGEKSDISHRHNRMGFSGGKATQQDSENRNPKLPHWNLTSDSELSSSDVESAGRKSDSEGRSAFSKVRQMSCSLLLCLIQVTEPYVLFSFWPSLLPDGVPTGPGHLLPSPLKVGEVTLATLILRDPTSKGRALASIVLASLLTSWQRFLIQAECSREKKTMSFTPFSIALGWSMCALHKHMCLAFSIEMSPVSILQLLRCCTAMLLASSYHKLASGLLHRLVVTVRPLLKHRDPCVVGGVLSLYGAVASLDPTPPELIQVFSRSSSSKLLESDEATEIIGVPVSEASVRLDVSVEEEDMWDNEFYDDEEDPAKLVVGGVGEQSKNVSNQQEQKFSLDLMHSKGPHSVPWIIEVCLKPLSLKDRSASIPVQTECLQVLTSISKNQDLAPRLLFHQDFWHILQTRFVVGSGDVTDVADSFPLKFHWARFWESLGRKMIRFFDVSEESTILSLPQAVLYWQTLLSGTSMVSLIQDMENPSLRAVGCDVLASIGAPIFGHLTRDKQILCETLLFGSSRDEEPSVKSAALRALGIFTLFPTLREDLHFLLDTFDTLQSALESDPGRGEVWLNASWALANLCDALILNREEGIADELPEGSFLELLEASACVIQPLPKGGSSGDRVRFNGVRAAGSVIRLIDLRGWDEMAGNMSLFSLGKRGKEAAEKVVVALVDAATKSCDMKVRWNACYAISNMLKNNTLYENGAAYADLVTKAKVFPSLCSLVRDFRNLKVRINAAVALSSPRLHSNYGQRNFLDAWKALLEGLDNSQRSGIDIAGHNHQQNLVDQIVLTLCHLAKLVERGDLSALGEIVDPYMEIAQAQMIRRSQTLVPEKASIIAEAASHLGVMKKNSVGEMICWTKSEEEGLKKLIQLFSPEETIEYDDSYPF